MAYFRRVVKRRPASLLDDEWIRMTKKRGGEPRPPTFGGPTEPVLLAGYPVLCCFCRQYHSVNPRVACMPVPEKEDVKMGSSSSSSNAQVGELLKQYPEIWDFLTASKTPSGKSRQTGRLSLSCEGGQLRLSLTDAHTGSYATLSGATFDELLLGFEVGLSDSRVAWRPSSPDYTKPRKRS